MLKATTLFLLLALQLFATTIEPIYLITSDNIKLRDIISNAKYDITLYKIEKNRYSKKIKTRDLLQVLASHGFKDAKASSRYVKFIKKSPIDLSHIKNTILQNYKEQYPTMLVESLQVIPRGYITALPDRYEIVMPRKFHLSNKGILNIRTLGKKKIFFDYLLDATLNIYETKHELKKATKVSSLNTSKKRIQFFKFKATPINTKQLNTVQFKRNIKSNKIVTQKDIQALYLVKKGANTIVNFNNNNINISFSAKALQSGKLHDIITVQKRDMKRLRVQIIGKNQVSIR